jgi:tetratricopeptide (TPR) repeat protein
VNGDRQKSRASESMTYDDFKKGAMARRVILASIVCVLVVAGLFVWNWKIHKRATRGGANSASAPTYVGEARCAQCHAAEARLWSESDHAHAMQTATPSTVLGDFGNAHFSKDDVTSTFYKRDNKFFVRTVGPDGKLRDYEVAYTFGIYPLQQYLIPFPGGRLQSLALAWDAQPKKQGGQHWFHLYPHQKVPYTDPLHWTGRDQTWNFMCADCHSTNLRTNYDLANDSYSTTWSEINVSCEQCHGPGSNHVAWAQARGRTYDTRQTSSADGLVVDLRTSGGSWAFLKASDATKHWTGQQRLRTEIETCAPCHSRRRPITSPYQPGDKFLDSFAPALLDEDLYYPDGQILGEDYEYGSIVQSKMYRNGVTCADCHDPHSGKLKRTTSNATCGQCHSLAKYGTPAHHHHKQGSAAADCVSCHMPTRTYMVVDPRRDHSFRVPRPDLSIRFGTPNACNDCHRDKPVRWTADAVVRWYGPVRDDSSQFVEAIDAGRRGTIQGGELLASLILDSKKPAIARATALNLIPEYLNAATLSSVRTALEDPDGLVRAAAVRALEPLSFEERTAMAGPLLADPVRIVRIESARLLAGAPRRLFLADQISLLDRAISELITSEMASSQRPENHLNLSLLYAQMGRYADAEGELRTALRLNPNFVAAMVNLADLYRAENSDGKAQEWLEKAIAIAPNAAGPVHALGLLKIRQKQYPQALALLAKAVALEPNNTRYNYVYAVALYSTGQSAKAISILERTHQIHAADRDVIKALIAYERDNGNAPLAMKYAKQLMQLDPGDPNVEALLSSLGPKSQ